MKNKVIDNNTKKTKNKMKYENLYLYVQIIVTVIMLLSCIILKVRNNDIFYSLKEDYKVFFTTETVYESNFSYKKFIDILS